MTSAAKTPHKNKPLNSLRIRIMVSALLLIVVVLPSIGVALNNAFEHQVRANVEDQLHAYFYSILAVTEMEDGQLLMPDVLLENQFNVINSGLYALITGASKAQDDVITQQKSIIWFSNSFIGADLQQNLVNPELGNSYFGEITLNNEAHLIYSYSVRFEHAETNSDARSNMAPVSIHIIKDLASVIQQQKAFSEDLWTWLVILIVVLLLIQIFWLNWTLRPLARFTQELNSVRTGDAKQLSQRYPNELNAVAKQLNGLLQNEQQQRKRYRNALSDLAHSLKTPLAVMQSQKELSASSMEQLKHINQTISHQLKRAQSAGGDAWHLGIKVSLVSNKLLRTLAKIYPKINLYYAQDANTNASFHGDAADLIEVLGNLLDNACKAANSRVSVGVFQQANSLLIVVEDDGKGVSNTQKTRILERGKRADTYEQGHGIGLAIVRDLVESYNGQLSIETSTDLGGAKFVLCFPQP